VETPFLTNCGKVKATGVFHEWQTDVLGAAATNAQLEGDDSGGDAQVATVRVGNYCQISTKDIVVSGTQEAVRKAGRDSEVKYLVAKAGKELKRDMEYAIVRNQRSYVGSEATARTTGSVESWMPSLTTGTNVVDGTGGTTPAYSSGVSAPTDASSTNLITFTEARLKTVIQAVWTDGGEPKIIMVGPVSKTNASAFAGVATKYKEVKAGQATIVGGADMYVSDFGEHMIVPNRFQRDRTALVLDMDYWKVATLRPIQQVQLSKTGDNEKRMLVAEYALVSANHNASGKIADLITS